MIGRVQEIDDLVRGDHYYLTADDRCFFFGEYTARKGYAFSSINQLIINLKKKVDLRGTPQWKYKGEAIRKCSALLGEILSPEFVHGVTLVPMPPSKAVGDPLYDDRLIQVLEGIEGLEPDVRPLLRTRQSTVAAHETVDRPKPDQIFQNLQVDEAYEQPYPLFIAIFDDVLTTGAHFVAAKRRLLEKFPSSEIVGLFLARCVRDSVLDDFVEVNPLLP